MNGTAQAGARSGDAMDRMEALVAGLDGAYGAAWSSLSYLERLAGSQEAMLYNLARLHSRRAVARLRDGRALGRAERHRHRRSGGVIGATVLGIFFVPSLFVLVAGRWAG